MSMTKRAYESAGNPFNPAAAAQWEEEAEMADRLEQTLLAALETIGVTGIATVARRLGYQFN